jgi:hypothetical protein
VDIGGGFGLDDVVYISLFKKSGEDVLGCDGDDRNEFKSLEFVCVGAGEEKYISKELTGGERPL